MAEVGGHVDIGDAIEIADAAIDYQTTFGGLVDVIEKIVADDRASDFLAEEIDDQHVARLEHVDRRLIVKTALTFGFELRLDCVFDVSARRHELYGESAAHQ